MKKVGYKPEFAGAVEASASTGGQFMPPIMGAGAFIMSEFLGISYLRIADVYKRQVYIICTFPHEVTFLKEVSRK